jgi:hypothetical protein
VAGCLVAAYAQLSTPLFLLRDPDKRSEKSMSDWAFDVLASRPNSTKHQSLFEE